MPRPLLALAVALVASLAFGAWLNDTGPWSEPATTPAGVAVVVDPSTGTVLSSGPAEAAPLIVPGDVDSVTYALQSVVDQMLVVQEPVSGDVPELEPMPPGFCSYRLDPDARTIQLFWKGEVPAGVLGAMPAVREALGITVTTTPVAHSADDVEHARTTLETSGTSALRGLAPRGSSTSLEVIEASTGNDGCGGVTVYVSTAGGAKPGKAQVAGVARTLAPLAKGVPVRVERVSNFPCDDESRCLP